MVDDEETLSSANKSYVPDVISISDTKYSDRDTSDLEVVNFNDNDSASKTIESISDAIDIKPMQILIYRWYKNAICKNDRSEDKMRITEKFSPN